MEVTWQPIESAPKDGTYIILGDNRYKGDAYFYGAWDKHVNVWRTPAMSNGKFACWMEATHWMPLMPLPEPPK